MKKLQLLGSWREILLESILLKSVLFVVM